jgi:hypothetical protein
VRFKGTLILLIVCLGLGAYLYFYEIKGGEKREKAKQAENQVWKLDSNEIKQIDIFAAGQSVTLARTGEKAWEISAPRSFEADLDEANRLANSASNIARESVVEENAADLARFGLNPPQSTLKLKTKGGKEYEICFGDKNPTGSFNYALIQGSKRVFLVASSAASAFEKKLDDLRNHSVLSFDKNEVLNLSIKSPKGDISLEKDGNDQWWLAGKDRVPADSPGIRGILNSLSMARVKEFYVEPAEGQSKSAIDRPFVDVSLILGKNKSIKHLIIGPEKNPDPKSAQELNAQKLYLAKDESRFDLFYVDKELVDKLTQLKNDLRDKALAVFQRWDIDSIFLTNPKGAFKLIKTDGEWFIGDAKKKAKWDAVNGILDAIEKKTVELIDNPVSLSKYGLDNPTIHVVLKQGNNVMVDCSIGGSSAKGIYAQVKGDPAVKIVDAESVAKLYVNELDLIEPPAAVAKPKK